jgi:hypothetical protein
VFTRAKVLLPAFGIAVALILGIVASQQRATGLQDSQPFVAPARRLCESINAPATLWLGGLVLLAHSIHLDLSWPPPIPEILFLGGIALLWFVVGLEVELRLTKTPSAMHRVVAASVAIAVAVALVPVGVAAWQEQVALSIGCAVWSAALTLFYCTDLARLVVWRVLAR